MISLARKILIYEWRKFIPVVFSVGFAGILLIVQAALVSGIFGSAAIYIKASSADIWVGYPGTQSINYGRQIPADIKVRLKMDPDIAAVESYLLLDGDWSTTNIDAGSVSIYLSGISTHANAMMFSHLISNEMRERLNEPGAIIVDPADIETLGVTLGGRAWIDKQPVHVVGLLKGLRGLGGVNVLTSQESAQVISGINLREETTYYVARLKQQQQLTQVLRRFSQPDSRFGVYEIWSAQDFAFRSQRYWLLDTGAGVAVVFMAGLVLLVGLMITSQSLKAVVLGYSKEYATLNALGASRCALVRVVIEQSFWIGIVGIGFAFIGSALLLILAKSYQVPIEMSPFVLFACTLLLTIMVLLSSLSAIHSQLRIDPSLLLR